MSQRIEGNSHLFKHIENALNWLRSNCHRSDIYKLFSKELQRQGLQGDIKSRVYHASLLARMYRLPIVDDLQREECDVDYVPEMAIHRDPSSSDSVCNVFRLTDLNHLDEYLRRPDAVRLPILLDAAKNVNEYGTRVALYEKANVVKWYTTYCRKNGPGTPIK